MQTVERALEAGIAQFRPGNKLGDVSYAIGRVARDGGYDVNLQFGGHVSGTRCTASRTSPNDGRPVGASSCGPVWCRDRTVAHAGHRRALPGRRRLDAQERRRLPSSARRAHGRGDRGRSGGPDPPSRRARPVHETQAGAAQRDRDDAWRRGTRPARAPGGAQLRHHTRHGKRESRMGVGGSGRTPPRARTAPRARNGSLRIRSRRHGSLARTPRAAARSTRRAAGSGRTRRVRFTAARAAQEPTRAWWPLSSTSGTSRPRHEAGFVYEGYSSRPSVWDSSTSDSGLPTTPGTSRPTASIIAVTATSPPFST